MSKKTLKMIEELQQLLGEKSDSQSQTMETIQALRDTDYRDQTAYFKMVQLLKGLAAVSDTDDTASEYLSRVSDALSSIDGDSDESGEEENS